MTKAFTVEDMERYQQLKAELRLMEVQRIQLKTRQQEAQCMADSLAKQLAEMELQYATAEQELSTTFAELEAHPELINVPPTPSDSKKRRQPYITEDIKNMMFLKMVTDHIDYDGSDELPLKQLKKALGVYFELHPRSVSNFFKSQLEGEELIGGTKNRALKLPLKTEYPEYRGELRLDINMLKEFDRDQIYGPESDD